MRGRMVGLVAAVLLFSGQQVKAWQPVGWVWFQSPYAYSYQESLWYYLNPGDTMYCYNYTGGTWSRLGENAVTAGWSYFQWPHAYALTAGGWFYCDQNALAWCFCFRHRQWSALGAPTGMVLIPGGSNSGGNPLGPCESYGSDWYPPTYSLTVGSFYMDRYEVTKALWDEVKNWNGGNGYSYDNAGSGKALNHPVQTVNWYDCVKWCNARSQKEGRTPAYYTDAACTQIYKTGRVLEPYVKALANGYRLPTDAQWEYAARGGVAGKRFPWGGNTISHGSANYNACDWSDYDLSSGGYHPAYATGGHPYTSPVGAFEAGKNAYGLYDMAGNVWEWCYDWHPGYVGSARVIRGGSWHGDAYGCRVGTRVHANPDTAYFSFGFRAVLPPGQ